MAYDDKLAARVRAALGARANVAERKMFGGVAFLLGGHMCCGVVGSELMVRVGAAGYPDALARPHARPMDFTGRPLTGMVYVAAAGLRTAPALRRWVDAGADHAASLPPKAKAPARRKRPPPGKPRRPR